MYFLKVWIKDNTNVITTQVEKLENIQDNH